VDAPPESTNDLLRQIWCGEDKDSVFISAGGYTRQTAIETAEEKGGMVAFGRLYIPNVSPLCFMSVFSPFLHSRMCCCTDIFRLLHLLSVISVLDPSYQPRPYDSLTYPSASCMTSKS